VITKLHHGFAPIIVIGIISGVLSWDGEFDGGDIAAARKSYLGDSPIDIWGAFSGFFYGNFPNVFIPWGAWLLLFHLFCTVLGLFLIWKHLLANKVSRLTYLCFVSISYVLIGFVCYLTRDSTMAALYTLGLGIVIVSEKAKLKYFYILFFLGVCITSVSISFRPWLFFASIFPILLINRSVRYKRLLIGVLAIIPFLLDQLSYSTGDFNKVHPELQVVIHDLGYMSCVSNDKNIRTEATNILNSISATSYTNTELCGDFRLSTWQGLGKWSASPKELGITFEPFDSPSKITISTTMTESKYDEIRNKYLTFLVTNSKDYLQNKIIQLTQVVAAGDTFGFRVFENSTRKIEIKNLFFVPYDFLISFHLLSPLFTIIFAAMLIFIRYSKLSLELIFINTKMLPAAIFVISWSILTTIAYINDIGRYVYLSTLIFYLLLILDIPTLESMRKQLKVKSAIIFREND